ncbi:glycosyltransferase [Sphingobium sufflavum]|uniref:glycosyltransferase n=1 Tax=Sphingobium sufflavum TaxID=1129547 RepID=UPI001F45D550|nr:glycosyltransferase [Sphingobium sufflavum]MCE7797471.1 glycosyltransferase [Sphingobium sufflavum]
MAQPWLSVILPVHGGARYLAATLDSVRAQRTDGIEFLLYDSSPDTACRDIAARYAADLDLRHIAVQDVLPWPEKTDLGVAQAAAPHVAMLHQDDLWLAGHVDAIRASIAAAPDAVMHVAASRLVDDRGRDIGQWSPPFAPGLLPGALFGRRLIVQNFLAIPSPVVRRDAWLAVGGMDHALWYTGDWDLYLKLARTGPIAVRARATTAFRVHGQSLTMTGSRDADALRGQFDRVLERHGPEFGLNRDRRLRARAMASVDINCGLAGTAAGQGGSLWPTLRRFLGLGPVDALRYLYESRILERAAPRLRARLCGVL